jgi:hypothetical protein
VEIGRLLPKSANYRLIRRKPESPQISETHGLGRFCGEHNRDVAFAGHDLLHRSIAAR